MSENKTVPTEVDVEAFLADVDDTHQAEESRELIEIMRGVSGHEPVMWGSAIIGFGSHHYKYASGREGDEPMIAFSPRKGKFALYVTYDTSSLVEQFPNLGTYTTSKSCIYIKRLDDVDREELKRLIEVAYKLGK